ncbi:MAG: hypothetical protein GPJ51_08395 [Candidatus Heimdallarchaeota archaeon]|nr:hypothetical protein [Candidatus Heimdallarchaeota archaeon]
MSSVKMIDKEKLDRLAAKILLRTGKKYTQQELLRLCVQFTDEKLDEFIMKLSHASRIWTKEEIKQFKDKFVIDFGEGTENLSEEVDKIVYDGEE